MFKLCYLFIILWAQVLLSTANAYQEKAFVMSRLDKLVMPKSQKFSHLDRPSRRRFKTLLSMSEVRDALNEEKVKEFATLEHELSRAQQIGRLSQIKEWEDKVDSVYKELAGQLGDVLKENPHIEERLKNHHEFSLKFGQEEDLPGFCEHFPVLRDEDYALYFSHDQGSSETTASFHTCLGDKPFDVSLKEIMTTMNDLERGRMKEFEKKAREKLMIFVSQNVMDKKNEYKDLFENLGPANDNFSLGLCLEKETIRKEYPEYYEKIKAHREKSKSPIFRQRNKNLEQEFSRYHASQAVMVQAQYSLLQEAKSELESLMKQKGVDRRCARTGRYPGVNCKRYKALRRAKKEKARARITQLQLGLERMMKESPLLFDTINDMDLAKFKLTDIQLRPSALVQKYIGSSNKASALVNLFKEQFAVHDARISKDNVYRHVLNNHRSLYDDYHHQLKGRGDVERAESIAVSQHRLKMDEGLHRICSEEGAYLHHFDSMYPALLKEMAETSGDKQEIIETQAGLCSLLRRSPIGEKSHGGRYYAGLVIGISGLAIAGVTSPTGVGPIVGNAIAASGGLLMGYDIYDSHQQASIRQSNRELALYTKWGDVRKFIEAREETQDEFNEGVVELVLATGSVGVQLGKNIVTPIIKRFNKKGAELPTDKREVGLNRRQTASGQATLEVERRTVLRREIDRLDQELGTQKDAMLSVYLPEGLPKLVRDDQIYFASLADYLEKEARLNPQFYDDAGNFMSDKAQEQIKKELDEVLNKCQLRN